MEYIMGEEKILQNTDRTSGYWNTLGLHRPEIIRVIIEFIKRLEIKKEELYL